MNYLSVVLDILFVTYHVYEAYHAKPARPWYLGRKINIMIALVWAALLVRDSLKLF